MERAKKRTGEKQTDNHEAEEIRIPYIDLFELSEKFYMTPEEMFGGK